VFPRDENVLRLEVSMDDARLVDGTEPFRNLAGHVEAELLGHTLQLLEEPAERLPLHVLQHQIVVGLPVEDRRVAIQRAHDVLVSDVAPEFRLPEEALEEPRLLQELGVDDLQGDDRAGVAPGRGTARPGPIHRPHAPDAETIEDLVLRQASPLHGPT
jgi:hypothetical protein